MTTTLLLLGSGELGKEFVISAKRLGCRVIAVDSYAGAPAMQVADAYEVIDMLNGAAIAKVVKKHKPSFIVPEIEAIRTEKLLQLEKAGHRVVPSARAAHLTMNRDAIRDVAARTLGLPTAQYGYAESATALRRRVLDEGGVGLPCVVKPVMSSSGKGQSVARTTKELDAAWKYAVAGMRGDRTRVIVEEFIQFDYEITLLTVKQRKGVGPTVFVAPIGHRQERGDYQESWIPCHMDPRALAAAQRMAKRITDHIAGPKGAGIFGVEFFVSGDRVIFSELSPRPHDTGMVTLRSQDLSEFDLHARAILGLPIPSITYYGATASAVILAKGTSKKPPTYAGLAKAVAMKGTEVRIFGKPQTRPFRRMGVVLASGTSVNNARSRAADAARHVKVT
jgi:phosphoribosylglycinamide formyltransferase 2